ncbi:MAG TPA: YciI family protein [Vicinamibacterales bacterium]|nr:YciI family protein [Vicinamibacterales bacterium]
MRYLCVYRSEEGQPPSQQLIANMGRLIAEMVKAGVLLATEGCQPSAKGVRVRKTGKRVTVVDGPFTEAKEVIGGFALIKVDSKEEAIEWTKRFLEVAGDGESEIRLLHEQAAHA